MTVFASPKEFLGDQHINHFLQRCKDTAQGWKMDVELQCERGMYGQNVVQWRWK
jgi:hypothetical protein